jgi:hypothetical protein
VTHISGERKEGLGFSSRAALAASTVLAVTAASGFAAAPSLGATASRHRASCPHQTSVQPFRAYGDTKSYFLAPGGGFATGGTGWKFTGGAQVIADPLSPSGYAALIPSGGSITSPPICVMKHEPTSRVFGVTQPVATSHKHGKLSVRIINHRTGKSKAVGSVPQRLTWGPTRKMTLSNGWLKLTKRINYVQYRFTVTGDASWELTDLYVDPRMSH